MKKKVITFTIVIALLLIVGKTFHIYTKIYCAVKKCEPAVKVVDENITFPEGYTVDQIFNKIAQNTNISKNELKDASKDTSGIGLPKEANKMLEGWLFPDTYNYVQNVTTAKSLLQNMIDNTINRLNAAGIDKKDWNKTIILASMIEKEAKIDSDRPKVARVFLNRLKKDKLLQSDATVSYGTGKTDSVWTTDAQRNSNNGYNTYKRKGLPVGAICNPGISSINAAVHPANGTWMFFVVVNLDTGKTIFSNTESEHKKAVSKLNAWLNKNK